jgi:poly-D-alanine transfer protein DltD
VHDSLVFDLHPSEHFLIDKISTILSHHKNMFFGMAYSLGPNYQDLDEVDNVISE